MGLLAWGFSWLTFILNDFFWKLLKVFLDVPLLVQSNQFVLKLTKNQKVTA